MQFTLLLLLTTGLMFTDPTSSAERTIADAARKIIRHQQTESRAYEILQELCDDVGHRLSGSKQAEEAVRWAVETFRGFGIQNVRRQPIMVPKWVRGDPELVELLAPRRQRLAALALGGSVGTPAGGLEAEVVAVENFEELKARGDEVEGKIVLFNKAMGPDGQGGTLGYGDVVPQRVAGAILAGRLGALGSVIRSVGTADFRLPHTGVMNYAEDVPKIPHAAIATEDADLIVRLLKRGKTVRLRMKLDCSNQGEVPSANVIAEIRGTRHPEQVVVIGGHLDSWDVGQGAHDDGVGIAATIETLRLLNQLGLRPRRTIRAVLFMNEENGLAGGNAYAKDHARELDDHVAAVEMDGGAFGVRGFGISAGEGGVEQLKFLEELLAPIGANQLKKGGGGADISPMRSAGVPQLGLRSDTTRYFDYHHTAADTLDKVDPEELAKCTAALAIMAFALAEMEEPLPRLK